MRIQSSSQHTVSDPYAIRPSNQSTYASAARQQLAVGSGQSSVAETVSTTTTGATSGLLSPGTTGQVIQSGQGDTTTAPDISGSGLSLIVPHFIQDIANDPSVAEQAAKQLATGTPLVLLPIPGTGGIHAEGQGGAVDPAAIQKFEQQWQKSINTITPIQQKLHDQYQLDASQGKSGAETYSDLLKIQLSQSDSYWQALDPQHSSGDLKAATQAELNALQQARAASPS